MRHDLNRSLRRVQRLKVTVNSHPGPASGLHELGLELPGPTASVRKTKADGVFGNPFLAKTEFSAGEHEEQMGTLGQPPCREHSLSSCGNIFKWETGSEAALPTGSYRTHLAPACVSLKCPTTPLLAPGSLHMEACYSFS